ncbi:1-acyl-sn-glycerol-3-phosphate acyltransferase [Fulvimarina endophytica]|uniref:1-acyl-sn-glycerol-3-phosphate acyltransferase n=1 Tax=Fulvimarina endophytica TaxID=2293836 RepID=A0A371X5Q9_9HYPH|nr:lysophospholipid acyltransferase family protein [Fulvimarina endophytica]RFC64561.1 1-acyl-sn-glycerol-3-phosphate acyltransferase [Fulvimarina endophytica]
MLILRSVAFQIVFYANFVVRILLAVPVMLFGSEAANWRVINAWCRSSLWILEHVAGTRSRFDGLDQLPKGQAIIASKHQSFWEIIALVPHLDRPSFILKKELMSIPLFGHYAKVMGMIPVDRAKRGGAIASMLENAHKAVKEGRQIVIFPEGTRSAPGSAPDYRQGIYRLYEALDLPVVPVALNSGLYWPRKDVRRWKGTIRAEFLRPIEPGLSRLDFFEALRGSIEARSGALLATAYREDGLAPRTPEGRRRLDEVMAAET